MAIVTHVEAPVVTGLLDAAAMDSIDALLRRDGISESEAAVTLRTIRSSVNRLQALKLKVISAAQRSQIGVADGLVDAGAWVARESRIGGAEAARSVRLAGSLESLPQTNDALADGLISVQHAEVIATATKELPPTISPAERTRVESALTEQAKSVDPATLRKASRRAVEIAGRSIVEADEHENQLVRTAEEVALLKTRLSMHDNDDGTLSGHFTVPNLRRVDPAEGRPADHCTPPGRCPGSPRGWPDLDQDRGSRRRLGPPVRTRTSRHLMWIHCSQQSLLLKPVDAALVWTHEWDARGTAAGDGSD